MIATLYTRVLQLAFLSSIIALSLGINYLSAWTGPTALPPNNNIATPLNVSQTPQVKDGNVSVGKGTNTQANIGLTVYGSQSTNGTVYGNGNAGGVLGHGVYGTAGGTGMHGVVGIGPNNNTGYGVIGVGGSSSYYGTLGRADGYSFVGNGESYNIGIVRSTSGGFAFPDGTVQTTAAVKGTRQLYLCPSGNSSGCGATLCAGQVTNASACYAVSSGGTFGSPSNSSCGSVACSPITLYY